MFYNKIIKINEIHFGYRPFPFLGRGFCSSTFLSDPARSSEGLNQMVQSEKKNSGKNSEKTENKVIQNAADHENKSPLITFDFPK